MQDLLTLSTFFTRTVKRGCVELGVKALFRNLFASLWGWEEGAHLAYILFIIFYVLRSHIENKIFSAGCKRKVTYIFFFHCFYSETMFLTQRWSRFSSFMAVFHLESFPVFFKIFILALRSQIFEGDPRWIGLNNAGQTTYLITVYSSCNWQEIIFHTAFFIVSNFSILRGEKWKANITTFCISMTWNWRWVAI